MLSARKLTPRQTQEFFSLLTQEELAEMNELVCKTQGYLSLQRVLAFKQQQKKEAKAKKRN